MQHAVRLPPPGSAVSQFPIAALQVAILHTQLTRRPEGEGAWGALEAMGRFAMVVFATPMALAMRMREALALILGLELENEDRNQR